MDAEKIRRERQAWMQSRDPGPLSEAEVARLARSVDDETEAIRAEQARQSAELEARIATTRAEITSARRVLCAMDQAITLRALAVTDPRVVN